MIKEGTHITFSELRVAFIYITEKIVKKILTSFIGLMFEYVAVVWNPHL